MSDGYLGLYQGTVADNLDPAKAGAVRCLIPSVLADRVSGWCQPIYPVAPQAPLPPVGTVVWVHFANGDLTKPVYFSSGEINAAQITAGTVSADHIEATDIYGHIFSTATGPTDTTTYPRLVIDPTAEALIVAPTSGIYGGVFGRHVDDGGGNSANELVISAPYAHSGPPYTIDETASASIRLGQYAGSYYNQYSMRLSSNVDLIGQLRTQGLVFSQALEGAPVVSNILRGSFTTGSLTPGQYTSGTISFSDGLGSYTFPDADGWGYPDVVLTVDNGDPTHGNQAFDVDVRLVGLNAGSFNWAAHNSSTTLTHNFTVHWIAIGS